MKKSLVLALALLATLLTATAATAAKPARWQVQATVNPVPSNYSSLASISCPTNAWCMSVGVTAPSPAMNIENPIAEVRYGATWQLVPVPKPAGATFAGLSSVSCPTTSTCFAVGFSSRSATNHPLIERWDGSHWSILPAGTPAGLSADLAVIRCTSAQSCLAVGSQAVSEPGAPPFLDALYAVRWNGTAWGVSSIDGSPDGADRVGLTSMSCASATTCFAVGLAIQEGNFLPVAERYTNGAWQQVTLPIPAGKEIAIWTAVSCPTAKSCLAVGQLGPQGDSGGVFAASWNGHGWRSAPAPRTLGAGNSFNALSCRSSTSCVGVGDTGVAQNDTSAPYSQRLAGGTWVKLPVPQPKNSAGASLTDIDCRPSGPCLAVGGYTGPGGFPAVLGEILH